MEFFTSLFQTPLQQKIGLHLRSDDAYDAALRYFAYENGERNRAKFTSRYFSKVLRPGEVEELKVIRRRAMIYLEAMDKLGEYFKVDHRIELEAHHYLSLFAPNDFMAWTLEELVHVDHGQYLRVKCPPNVRYPDDNMEPILPDELTAIRGYCKDWGIVFLEKAVERLPRMSVPKEEF